MEVTMKRTDKLIAPSRGSVAAVYAWALKNGAREVPERLDFLFAFLVELWRLCQLHGFDFLILAAQSAHETAKWSSANWKRYGNPGGIAILNDDNQSDVFATGQDAARAFVIHTWAYVHGNKPLPADLEPYKHLDKRFNNVLTGKDDANGDAVWDGARLASSVTSIVDYNVNGRWCWFPAAVLNAAGYVPYGDKIVSRGNAMLPGVEQGPVVDVPSTPEEPIPVGNIYKRVPHPPSINLPVSKPNGGGYGYTLIPKGSRRIVGVMNHETQGRGSGQWYRDFFSCPNGDRCGDALVDYLITRDGTIYRLNDPFNDRSPWANGGPLGLEGDGASFYSQFGASGVNNRLISIEYEKTNAENYTPEQVVSGGLLNAYWHDQDSQDWDQYPYVPRYSCVTSMAHFEISTTDCGKGELDDITLMQAVAKGEMKKWQTLADPDVPSVPDTPDVPELPPAPIPGGVSLADATAAFGSLIKHTPDGKTKAAPFDPEGVISLSWARRCVDVFGVDIDRWPEAEDWYAVTDSGVALDLITFSNEWQLVRFGERQGLMWANFGDAELVGAR
jgi:hypothetical protein